MSADAAPQAESMQHEAAVVINEFGDTIDPALLRELEESENASDVSGDQEPEDVSIEDIFNIDRDQISGQQIDNDLLGTTPFAPLLCRPSRGRWSHSLACKFVHPAFRERAHVMEAQHVCDVIFQIMSLARCIVLHCQDVQ